MVNYIVLVTRRDNGTLGNQIYRKPPHADRYRHKDWNHQPVQKQNTYHRNQSIRNKPANQSSFLSAGIKRTLHSHRRIENINQEPRSSRIIRHSHIFQPFSDSPQHPDIFQANAIDLKYSPRYGYTEFRAHMTGVELELQNGVSQPESGITNAAAYQAKKKKFAVPEYARRPYNLH